MCHERCNSQAYTAATVAFTEEKCELNMNRVTKISDAGTDGQTLYRYVDPSLHTV